MVKIEKISINNYKSCIKTDFILSDNLSVLIGVNGAGKSNILNSLKLLKRNEFNRYRIINKKDSMQQTSVRLLMLVDGIKCDFKAEIHYETNEKNDEKIIYSEFYFKYPTERKWIPIDGEIIYMILNQKISKDRFKKILSHQFSLSEIEFYNDNTILSLMKKILDFLNGINYYSATQFADPTRCSVSMELEDLRLVRSYRNNSSHDKYIFELFLNYKNSSHAFKKYLNTINKEGIGLVDDIKFHEYKIPNTTLEVRAGGQIKMIDRERTIVIPSFIIDGMTLSPNQLSEGTFKTLALLFYVINDNSTLLLVEEPEVCIHHGLLSSVIELIKIQSRNKQIILSTHSDYLLDKLEPENVIKVERVDSQGTKAKALQQSLSRNEMSALKSYLNNVGNLGEYWKEGGLDDE